MDKPNAREIIEYSEAEAFRLEAEAKALRRLADDLRKRFPVSVAVESTPIHPDLDAWNVDKLNAHLLQKRGRINHVAQRLGLSEALVDELLRNPESKFKIAQRGWIVPKT